MDASDRRRRASEDAAAWWVRLQAQGLPRAEREEFVDWLRESAMHVAEMLRIAKVHDALEQFKGWAQIATDGSRDNADGGNGNVVSLPAHHRFPAFRDSAPSPGDEHNKAEVSPAEEYRAVGEASHSGRRPGRTNSKRVWLGAMAAVLVAISISTTLLLPQLREQIIQTERGERREVALSDGSVVEVDPQTRLKIAFEKHVRRLFLERGRALFRVAKNSERPFLVEADGTTVRAVGTEFGVERLPKSIVVTVAEGKVGVYATDAPARQKMQEISTASGGASLATTVTRAASSSEVLLTADQQVRMPSSGVAEPVRKVNSVRELAWAKGQLVFDNESVAEAVEEFNRYNRVRLHVADDALGRRPVSGVFNASDPESFIGFLQTVVSVHITRGESEIIMQ